MRLTGGMASGFAMTLLVVSTLAVAANPVSAQSAGQLIYYGTLRGLADNGGVKIIAVAGPPQFADFKTCGQVTTSGTGTYSNLVIDKGCVAKDGSVTLYFLVHGEKAGKTSLRFYPPGRADYPEGLDATRVPGPPPADTPSPVLTRFYGTFQFDANAAPSGTPISISGNNGAGCGSGSVVDQQGGYVADVTSKGCVSSTGETHFLFSTGGQTVGNAAKVIDPGNADTYGNVHSLGLNGNATASAPSPGQMQQGQSSSSDSGPCAPLTICGGPAVGVNVAQLQPVDGEFDTTPTVAPVNGEFDTTPTVAPVYGEYDPSTPVDVLDLSGGLFVPCAQDRHITIGGQDYACTPALHAAFATPGDPVAGLIRAVKSPPPFANVDTSSGGLYIPCATDRHVDVNGFPYQCYEANGSVTPNSAGFVQDANKVQMLDGEYDFSCPRLDPLTMQPVDACAPAR